MLDKLLAEAFYNPRIVSLVQLIVHGDALGNRLHSLAVPDSLLGSPWAECFDFFVLQRSLVPLGLYRASDTAAGLRYCFTNPPPGTVVGAHDLVFAVGRRGSHDQHELGGVREERDHESCRDSVDSDLRL